jgi:hypothetical protein
MNIEKAKEAYALILKEVQQEIESSKHKEARGLEVLASNIETDLTDFKENHNFPSFIKSVDETLAISYTCQHDWGHDVVLSVFNVQLENLIKQMNEISTIGQLAGMYRAIRLEVMRDEVEAFKNNQKASGIRLKSLREILELYTFDENGKSVYKTCILAVLSLAYESQLGEKEPKIAGYIERLYDMAQIEVV